MSRNIWMDAAPGGTKRCASATNSGLPRGNDCWSRPNKGLPTPVSVVMTESPAEDSGDSHNHIDCLVDCGWPGCAAPPDPAELREYLHPAGSALGEDCVWRE